MNSERWLPVVGFEGRYEVSSHGQVRSLHPQTKAKNNGILGQRPLKGYHGVSLYLDVRSKKTYTVHSLMMAAFVGPRPTGYHVNHINGVRTDNWIENLEYVTPKENVRHAVSLGIAFIGSLNPAAKLTVELVRFIDSKTGKMSAGALARHLSVTKRSVLNVIHRKTWRHISREAAS